jgi:rare lipoprotein A
VVNRDTGKEAIVRINDRGPFIRGRIIDLSREAARRLGVEGPGIADVALYLAGEEQPRDRARRDRKSRRSEPRASRDVLPDGYWTVQVGSFSEERRARAYAKEMRAFHRDVRIAPSEGMFKVRLGRFETKSDAARLAAFLYDEEIDSWVLFEKR